MLLFASMLLTGVNYIITVPTASLRCDWWSITAYGYDHRLIPNQQRIYSFSSRQCMKAAVGKPVTAFFSDAAPVSLGSSSSDCLWIPLPNRQDSDALLGPEHISFRQKVSNLFMSKKCPYLTIRGNRRRIIKQNLYEINLTICSVLPGTELVFKREA
jgi:hypothetical protein